MIANVVAGAINRYTEKGDNYVQNRSYATALQMSWLHEEKSDL